MKKLYYCLHLLEEYINRHKEIPSRPKEIKNRSSGMSGNEKQTLRKNKKVDMEDAICVLVKGIEKLNQHAKDAISCQEHSQLVYRQLLQSGKCIRSEKTVFLSFIVKK